MLIDRADPAPRRGLRRDVRSLGPMPVKGLAAPLEVYELVGAGAARSRLQARPRRGPHAASSGATPSSTQLREALERRRGGPRAGRGGGRRARRRQVAALPRDHPARAAAGLARAREPARSPTARPRRTCPSSICSRAYFQVEDARRRPADPREGHGHSCSRSTRRSRADAARRCSRCSTCPSTTRGGRRSIRRSAGSARSTRSSALLLRESQVQPLLLVFEDLQWIDTETQALLDSLVESLPAARMLLLVNYRPEYQHGWGSKTLLHAAALDPLPPDERRRAARRAPGRRRPASSPLKRLLDRAHRGQPVLPRGERADAGRDAGPRRASAGAYRLARPLDVDPGAGDGAGHPRRPHRPAARAGEAPAAVGRGHRQGRAARAAPGARRAARGGAAPGAGRACRRRSSSTRPASFPDLEYTFKHALTHEVAYGALLHEHRQRAARAARRGHRAHDAGRGWPSRSTGSRITRSGAGSGTRRAASSARPAPRPPARSAYREAATASSRRWPRSTICPRTRERERAGLDLRFDLHNALMPLGDSTECSAPPRGGARPSARRSAAAWTGAAYMTHASGGRASRTVRWIRVSALAIAQSLGDLALEVVAHAAARPGLREPRRVPAAIDAFARHLAPGRGRGLAGRGIGGVPLGDPGRGWPGAWPTSGISPRAPPTPRRPCGWPRRTSTTCPGHDLFRRGPAT